MSAKKKPANKTVEFGASIGGKQWNRPQAAAKEMVVAIAKLASAVAADGDKLGKVQVELTIDLANKGTEFSGSVTQLS